MGTTSQKIQYLGETKSLLKDSINSLGGEITSQTTFRNYATELDSIYASLPKVSGTGTELSLSPTLKGRLGSVLKGNTFQQTYTGKNLLNLNNYIKGYFETTGTINYGVPARNCIFYLKCEPSTKYTFKTQTQNVAQIIIANTDETPDYGITISNSTTAINLTTLASTGYTYTTSSTSQYIVIRLQIATGYSYDYTTLNFTDFINNPQVELGPTATSYEPYVGGTASPNPDYPQNIQSVTGLQTITVSDGTNTQTKQLNLGNIKLNKIGDYQDYITGTPDNWVLHKNIGKIKIIVNSTITHYGGHHWIGFNKPSDSIMYDAGNFNRYKLYMEKAYYSNTNDAIYSYQTGLAAYAMGVMCNENDDPTTLKNQLDGSLMYYPLKEEITTPITNTELISQLNALYYANSYNGTTNISVEGDLPMILSVSALKGDTQ